MDTTFEQRMEAHVSGLQAALDQEEAAARDLRARTQEAEGNCERLRHALKLLAKQQPKRTMPRKRREQGTPTGYGLSIERAKEAADFILETWPRETFTQRDLFEGLGWEQSNASSAIRYLRSIEFLRMAGRDASRGRDLWAVMDADAFQRVWAEIFENGDANERLRLQFAEIDSEDDYERAAAFIREQGTVVGLNTLVEAVNIPHTRLDTLRTRLTELGLIDYQGNRGKKAVMTWIAETPQKEEMSNGAA